MYFHHVHNNYAKMIMCEAARISPLRESPFHVAFNTLRPRHNGRHFPDDTFKYIFLNENVIISATISLKFVPKGPINNIPALVQIMAWRRPGDKPLSEPMMVRLPTHICVNRPQWERLINSCKRVCSFTAWCLIIDYKFLQSRLVRNLCPTETGNTTVPTTLPKYMLNKASLSLS